MKTQKSNGCLLFFVIIFFLGSGFGEALGEALGEVWGRAIVGGLGFVVAGALTLIFLILLIVKKKSIIKYSRNAIA